MSNRFANTMYAGLLAACALSFSPAAAAKQCIWNKGGYVMSVSWFRPIDLGALETEGMSYSALRNIKPPVLVQTVGTGAGICTSTDEELVAFISVIGCWGHTFNGSQRVGGCLAPSFFPVDPGVRTSNIRQAAGSVVPIGCRPSLNGFCLVDELLMTPKLPDTPVLVAIPSTTRYLDFWGTTASVHWAPGGPIN